MEIHGPNYSMYQWLILVSMDRDMHKLRRNQTSKLCKGLGLVHACVCIEDRHGQGEVYIACIYIHLNNPARTETNSRSS
jgi:hypothetical protein